MHIPKDSIKSTTPVERIALIGAPGSGKTTSCYTFPNPYFIDFDNKLRPDTLSAPFWNSDFVDSIVKRTNANLPPNKRDAFKKWFTEEHSKFTPEQTIILDSWTLFINAIYLQERIDDERRKAEHSATTKYSKYQIWQNYGEYCVKIVELLKACRCRVVVTFHETKERNEEGDLTGKLKPIMNGGFKDQIFGYFTDVWRQVRDPHKIDDKGNAVIQGNQKVVEPGFFWNLRNDHLIETNTKPILGEICRKHNIYRVNADYNEILKLYTLSTQ